MNLPQLKIGDLVAKVPVIQGGMGVGISLSGLASAVAKEGGIGVIAAAIDRSYQQEWRQRPRKSTTSTLWDRRNQKGQRN